MKHIRKYNEGKEISPQRNAKAEEIYENIIMEFIHFVDDSNSKYDYEFEIIGGDGEYLDFEWDDDYEFVACLNIKIKKYRYKKKEMSIKQLIDGGDYYKEFYLDLDTSIKRVFDMYPKVKLSKEKENDIYIEFIIDDEI